MIRAVASIAVSAVLCILPLDFAMADEAPAKKPDAAKGATIAQGVCAACHGADGNATGNAYPKLAGQHEEYLYKQLTNFKVQPGAKSAARENAIMLGFATSLSDDDMHNVAAYFSQQTLKPANAKNAATVEIGQKIYRAGIAEKAVPACAGCHGPTGAGIPIQYPRIGGQWSEYIEAQLNAFRAGTRHNNLAMSQIAARLSDAEIKAVSDYIAGLR